MPHDDEREEAEARRLHAAALAELRDLRGDADYRLANILNDQAGRSPDSVSEVRRQREWARGELNALQRRIDQALDRLR